MPAKAKLLQISRKTHLYFGVFISPALLFFAITGALQTLGLHEAAGTSYKPPALLATLGQIHKKQTWKLPQRRPPVAESARPEAGQGAGQNASLSDQPQPHRNRAGAEGQPRSPLARDLAPDAGNRVVSSVPMASSVDVDHGPRVTSPDKTNATAGPANPGASAGAGRPTTLGGKLRQHLGLKLFFVLVSLGLCTSTLTGIYMAYKYDRNKLLMTLLLILGTVLPLALLPF